MAAHGQNISGLEILFQILLLRAYLILLMLLVGLIFVENALNQR